MRGQDTDIAYVLESVPGVLGAYAVRRLKGTRYAVLIENAGMTHAAAHYALLRVLTHEECRTVAFFHVDLPATIRANSHRIALTAAERAEARARVPVTSSALEQQPTLGMLDRDRHRVRAVLVVDMGSTVEEAARVTLGATVVRMPGIGDAIAKARSGRFDLILCDEAIAFGQRGFVTLLARVDPALAQRVVVIVDRLVRDSPRMHAMANRCIQKPVTYSSLLDESSEAGPFSIPIPPVRRPKRPAARVLLIDERASALVHDRFAMTVVRDSWAAFDAIEGDWDLVVCSLSMRSETGARLYSLLWKACPALKSRFALLVDETPDEVTNRVLVRPLAVTSLVALLDRIDFLPSS